MLGSTDRIPADAREKIRGLLKDIEHDKEGPKKKVLETSESPLTVH